MSEVKRNEFYFLNADGPEELASMLKNGLAIRAARKNSFAPNAEIKCAKKDLDFYCLENRLTVILNGNRIEIAPLELSIAFKLFLSSEKDIEDARFLFKMFQDKLNKEDLEYFVRLLQAENVMRKYLL